jgi:hypothetical protein
MIKKRSDYDLNAYRVFQVLYWCDGGLPVLRLQSSEKQTAATS